MATPTPLVSPGAALAQALDWLNANAHAVFVVIGVGVEHLVGGAETLLRWPAPWMVLLGVTLLLLVTAGPRLAALALVCLGLWKQSMETIALVSVSVSVLIAFPAGILAARIPRFERVLRPLLDIMQTVPPWVYLIPAVMIFSLGKVPALIATVVYGIPPMLRITTLAFQQVPTELIELGQASGASRWQVLTKLEIPAARKTLLVGLNQTILLSLAMVVLAGLVGAGGLGAEVTRGLTRMEIGLGLRAGLSIVAVAIFADRITRRVLS
ncbi:ABC transporter permease [Phaeovulum sp. W22_SRMD_FR3]|uniref:ABC transporter permease n=1 Tax=Phaeovulum sp. W22_SRMD_FR3 TaxID=3240274 RepID=UPI003F9C72DD